MLKKKLNYSYASLASDNGADSETPAAIAATVTLCFAATESRVSRANILSFERTIQEKLSASSADPYDCWAMRAALIWKATECCSRRNWT